MPVILRGNIHIGLDHNTTISTPTPTPVLTHTDRVSDYFFTFNRKES